MQQIDTNANHIIHEITPLSDEDCFYIAERYKKEFTYPIHSHQEYELNFTEKATGVRRIVGDSVEVVGEYVLVLITGKDLEHVWEQHECTSEQIREITIQFSSELFFKSFINKNQFVFLRGGIKLPAPHYQLFIPENKIVGQKITRYLSAFLVNIELNCVSPMIIIKLISLDSACR